jgi:hypothetical protein
MLTDKIIEMTTDILRIVDYLVLYPSRKRVFNKVIMNKVNYALMSDIV